MWRNSDISYRCGFIGVTIQEHRKQWDGLLLIFSMVDCSLTILARRCRLGEEESIPLLTFFLTQLIGVFIAQIPGGLFNGVQFAGVTQSHVGF